MGGGWLPLSKSEQERTLVYEVLDEGTVGLHSLDGGKNLQPPAPWGGPGAAFLPGRNPCPVTGE